MAERDPDDVTLHTLHEDLTAGFGEMRSGFADLKATLIAGFRGLPNRESSEEMVRLLRERNRQLDLRIREQHLETQQGQQALAEGQRLLVDGQRSLSADIRALIARIDALIKGRSNGEPAS